MVKRIEFPAKRFLMLSAVALAFFALSASPALCGQVTIGGQVIGLIQGGQGLQLELQDGGVNYLSIGWNGSFTFPGTVLSGSTYTVTVISPPSNPEESCAVTNGSGTANTNVTSIAVDCYSISGTVSGLPIGATLTLKDTATGGSLPIAQDGVFTFPKAAVSTTVYDIIVEPPTTIRVTCGVTNGSGTADSVPAPHLNNMINNIWVTCAQNTQLPLPSSHWTPLKNLAKDSSGNLFYPETMLLLSDGSVLVNGPANGQPQEWLRLFPDNKGSYVNGTWTSVPNSICAHGLYASQVLTDGRVFIAGGEYPGPGNQPAGCTGLIDTEIYDPTILPTGGWIPANPPASNPYLIDPSKPPSKISCASGTNQGFLDMISETLPDGSVLMAPVCPKNCGDTLIFNPAQFNPNSPGSGWSFAATLANTGGSNPSGYSCSQQEDTWVKLQDGSILTADPPAPPAALGAPQTFQTSERFFPSSNTWVAEPQLGFALYDSEFGWSWGGETGPAFLLPNGKAVFIGASPVIGTYDPTANAWCPTSITTFAPTTSWCTGSIMPLFAATGLAPLAAGDAPGAMMVNGKILLTLNFPATANNWLPGPVFFYEYDPAQGTLTEVLGPDNSGAPSIWTDCGPTAMLDLPDGTVLVESGCNGNANPQLYVYTPTGIPLAAGQPTIQSISAISGSCNACYRLTGTGLNGISEGASEGDDEQMATDFPLVRVTSGFGTFYARTYNWSSTVPNPGAVGSTDFELKSDSCDLQVVANGNASPLQSFTRGCFLPGSLVNLCNPRCALGSAAVWTVQTPLGDPWVDGASVSLLNPGPEANGLLEDEQVSVDTQLLLGPESERKVSVDDAAEGASAKGFSLIVGPTVELRDRGDRNGQSPKGSPSARALGGMVSIPYDPKQVAAGTKVRIVKFDDRRGRWVDAGPQTIDESKHVVTAGILGTGKFTVVAEVDRDRR